MDIKEIEAKVKALLIDDLEIEEENITPDALLKEDLGIDSLEVVDVVVLVEQAFGYKMKNEDFKVIKTYSDLLNFIDSKVNA